MNCKVAVALLILLILRTQYSTGYKVLGLFPYGGRSHMIVFKSLMEGLALRGHTVHVLSHFPRETPLANYTDFSVAGSIPQRESKIPKFIINLMKYDALMLMDIFTCHFLVYEHENVMKAEAVQRLLVSNEKYDLIITESFVTDMILGFVHKFKVPFVYVSSFSVPPAASVIMANPQNPAFVPLSITSRLSPKMNFFERLSNTISLLSYLALWFGVSLPANQKIMNKYFGDDMPPLLEIYKNASLILTNTHATVNGGRPLAPTVVEVGGVHIGPAKKLPPDIEKFIEESPYGVVYFSMGSLLRATSLPEENKRAFLLAFSKLKERVLWKYEEEDLRTPHNVMTKKWMPQRDILAHPKVKLFISHGGLLSTLEAVSEGKPVVGIPVFAEQGTNIGTLELRGVAKRIDYYTMDNATIYEAVQEMLKPQYMENAKELSRQFHDRPMSPMNTAVYWIEYVIRNNGAKILRSSAVDLDYYQYLLIDVYLFLLFSLTACGFVSYYFIKIFLCRKNKINRAKTKYKSQ